jgi:hypothetical protein
MIGVLMLGLNRIKRRARKAKLKTPKINATFFATMSFLFCDVIFKFVENQSYHFRTISLHTTKILQNELRALTLV